MLKQRVIPTLLLQNGGLVKTVKFANPKYVGDPINAIKIFNEKEVDELIVLDIDASKNNQEPNFELVEEFASECFMPLCYGGGIKSVEQAARLFSLGVEKVSLQTSVLDDTSLISQIAEKFGSQSVVVSVDIKKNILGSYYLYSSVTNKTIKAVGWKDFLKSVAQAGAGEILISAVDRDGLMNGMDTELISEAAAELDIPMIAIGGVGSLSDIKEAVDAGACAVAAGSFFVFHGPHRAVLITYPKYNDIEKLLSAS